MPCIISIEEVNEPTIVGVRGVVTTPEGAVICVTRVFQSVFPFNAGDRDLARARAVEMAEGMGYAEQAVTP